MKFSKSEISSNVHAIPEVKFENQDLTSHSGIIIFQNLFSEMGLKDKLKKCFSHLKVESYYGGHNILMTLIVHILIGCKQLRGRDYYYEDPVIKRVIGVNKIPDVSTIVRFLNQGDTAVFNKLRELSQNIVADRIAVEKLRRVTLDFDGSVISTQRRAEGPAVGFNKKHKGRRSYYPLLCTIAQTTQVFDVLHRAGNVHDSNGAEDFIIKNIKRVRDLDPGIIIEARFDSAFYSQTIIQTLADEYVGFTASVPFERMPELKAIVENRKHWFHLDDMTSYFETEWSPKNWANKFRIILIRTKKKCQEKGPLQLKLFAPVDFEHEYKAIVTNKLTSVKNILQFHNGRGTQEKTLGEMKSNCFFDYIPCRKLISNQQYMMASILAHNLSSELQMNTGARNRGITERRTPLWIFKSLATLRQEVINKAGRLTRPQGKIMLTLNANEHVKECFLFFLKNKKA